MKKPVVDYRNFRFSKLRTPEYHHLLYLLGWILFFILFFLTENLIPVEKCYPVHSKLDDMIPFCEYFVIPYTGWYLLIAGSLIYFALYNPDNFKKMNTYIIITMLLSMVIYVVFPSRQDLRPEFFTRDNIFTNIMKLLYSLDTNTGVCPSIHVAYSIGIASTWLREKSASVLCKTLISVFCFLVCISVVFVKQHSVIDIFAAIPICIIADWITFWYPKRK